MMSWHVTGYNSYGLGLRTGLGIGMHFFVMAGPLQWQTRIRN